MKRLVAFVRPLLAVLLLVPLAPALVSLSPIPVQSAASDLPPAGASARAAPQAWAPWASLGKPSSSWTTIRSVIGQEQDGRLEIFVSPVTGMGASISHSTQASANGAFGSWSQLSTETGVLFPAVVTNPQGRLEVMANAYYVGIGLPCGGIHGKMVNLWQTAPNGAWASSWGDLGVPGGLCDVGRPRPGVNKDGRIDLFTVSEDYNVWHIWQTVPSGAWATSWASLGKPASGVPGAQISSARNQDGRLAVFVVSGGEIYHTYQNSANDENNWSGWIGFGKPSGVFTLYNPAVAANADGRLEFFVDGVDGNMYHKWQTVVNGSWTPAWWPLGKPSGVYLGDPIIGTHSDGSLDMFSLGSDGNVWHMYQTAPSDGWTSWQSLGAPSGVTLYDLAVARNKNGYLVLVATDTNGTVWEMDEFTFTILPLGQYLYLPLLRR